MRAVNLIVIHCSASPPTLDADVNVIRKWHIARGFRDVGYHYVITRNGSVQTGRPLEQAGAHAEGHNANSIGVCLVGGVDRNNRAENNFEGAQMKSLKALVYGLKARFPDAQICGHRDLPKVAKDCPSFEVREWLNDIGLGGSFRDN